MGARRTSLYARPGAVAAGRFKKNSAPTTLVVMGGAVE